MNGAIILVISTLVVKVIGLCFKMPLGSMLGLVGYGYFTSVYAIYTPIYSISMAGLPIAVSRMVAEDVALNHYREARMTHKNGAQDTSFSSEPRARCSWSLSPFHMPRSSRI